jgi:P pilus assembly chaperone PapD
MKSKKIAMTIVLGSLAAGLVNEAGAAIALDRTRAIFPGSKRAFP